MVNDQEVLIMLSLLIAGPNSMTGDHIDIFMAPLIEELTSLWREGVWCQDVAKWRGETRFILKAILLWCLHDYPAYGIMVGVTIKGYRGCPKCGIIMCGQYSTSLCKIVYGDCHRLWLLVDHPWRIDVSIFPSLELQASLIENDSG